jgi:hypothetical protein
VPDDDAPGFRGDMMRASDPLENERLYGRGKVRKVHVACPWPGCDNDRWQSTYPMARHCARHEGGRIPMVRCDDCQHTPPP